MTIETGLHPLAQDYLARLSAEARRLPPDQAQDLVADIGEHLAAGLGSDPAEADVRNLLDRLGTPAEVVAAAGPVPAVPAAPPVRGAMEVGAVISLLVAELISFLIPIAGVMWIVGLVLLAISQVWSGREKLRGFLSLGTGFPLVLLVLGLALVLPSTTACTASTTSAPAIRVGRPGSESVGSTSPAVESACTTTGPPSWVGMVVLGLLLAYLVWQIRTAYVLLSRRRRD